MTEQEINYWLDDPGRQKAIEMWLSEGNTREEIAEFLRDQG